MQRLISISTLSGQSFLVNPDHIVRICSNGSYTEILTDCLNDKGKPYEISTKMQVGALRDIIDASYE